MTRIKQGLINQLDGVQSTIVGSALNVSSYRTIVVQLATEDNADATIQFAASMSLEEPDFSLPATPENQWSYVVITDLSTGAGVFGNIGVVLTGTDLVNLYEVSTNYIKWFCPIVTAYSAGKITVHSDAVDEYSRG